MKVERFNLPNDGKVVEEPWQDEAEATSKDIELEFATHPDEGKLVDPKEVADDTAKSVKEKIIKFRMKKFGGLALGKN